MRNLVTVLNEIIEVIPKENDEMINHLKHLRESASYSAPEVMYMWWNLVHESLLDYISDIPKEEWEWKVFSIFSTKSVEELKESMK